MFPRHDFNPEAPTEIGASGIVNSGFGHDMDDYFTVPEERILFVGVPIPGGPKAKLGHRYLGRYWCTRVPSLPLSVWNERSESVGRVISQFVRGRSLRDC
jgi:hypothetical protein